MFCRMLCGIFYSPDPRCFFLYHSKGKIVLICTHYVFMCVCKMFHEHTCNVACYVSACTRCVQFHQNVSSNLKVIQSCHDGDRHERQSIEFLLLALDHNIARAHHSCHSCSNKGSCHYPSNNRCYLSCVQSSYHLYYVHRNQKDASTQTVSLCFI